MRLRPFAADGPLTGPAGAFGRRCAPLAPDVVVAQLTTFADARLPLALADALPPGVPLLLWAPPPPAGSCATSTSWSSGRRLFTDFGAAACSFSSAPSTSGGWPPLRSGRARGARHGLARLAAGSPYLGDLATCDGERDAAVFWHCDAGVRSQASGVARAGVHPNRPARLHPGVRPAPR